MSTSAEIDGLKGDVAGSSISTTTYVQSTKWRSAREMNLHRPFFQLRIGDRGDTVLVSRLVTVNHYTDRQVHASDVSGNILKPF